MRLRSEKLQGNILPTVVVVSVLMLTALLGLLTLWEHELSLFERSARLRQARSDVESAFSLYRLHPGMPELTDQAGYRLYDSLPHSLVRLHTRPWGLYEAVEVCSVDSPVHICRLLGADSPADRTLWYADHHAAVTLAGQTALQGVLSIPRNGVIYGRMGSDFYRGTPIPRTSIRHSETTMPAPLATARRQIEALFACAKMSDGSVSAESMGGAGHGMPLLVSKEQTFPDSLVHSFSSDSILVLRLEKAEIGDCDLRGQIVLCADELRIDSTCRMEHLVVCARKITVGRGARITAQLFARDTILVETRAVLAHPSGIYAGTFAELGERSEVNGYAIVCDTTVRKKPSANYRQARTARLRGLLYVDGIAQLQGIVSGRAVLRQAVWFSPQGYYKDMLYDVSILENPVTVQPLWLAAARRKQAVCLD